MGQFDIGSEIGKGSFAQVYLGWHKVRLPIPPHHGDGGISTRCDVTGDPNRHQLPRSCACNGRTRASLSMPPFLSC